MIILIITKQLKTSLIGGRCVQYFGDDLSEITSKILHIHTHIFIYIYNIYRHVKKNNITPETSKVRHICFKTADY